MTAKTFRDIGVDDALCTALETKGITHPFPIQEMALPLALEGHDLIGQARTGTGKTLAFGLPLLQRMDPARKVTQALVIVPTRELAVQVHDDLQVGSELGLSTISVYGGTPYEAQIEALTTGVHVVVGTPGRLLDHLNRGNLDLSEVRTLVLDEADEMLDMGFLPDVERLIQGCNTERHSMLFSATMPTEVVKLARRYLTHPTFTRADTEQHETAPNVDQHFFSVHRMDKPRVLARILQTPDRGGAYVFVRTKHMADRLVDELESLSIPAVPVHGDLRQTTREKNLDRFRDGSADVLVCTEVAARGLDVENVTHVVNYDCPDDEKMYLHRIGRTARAGAAGVAVTFAEFNEADRLNVIRKAVGATETEVKQIFSTSDELTELFNLPAERPWDHLATRGGGDRSGSGKRSGGESGRRGRSDGRSKNRSGSDGAKGTSSRDRDVSRRPKEGSEPRQRAEAKDRPDSGKRSEPAAPSGGRGEKKSAGGREQRPARQRAGTSAGRETSGSKPSGSETSSSETRGGSRGTTGRGGEAARTRTRTRSRTRDAGRDDSADRTRGGGDDRSDGGRASTSGTGRRDRDADGSSDKTEAGGSGRQRARPSSQRPSSGRSTSDRAAADSEGGDGARPSSGARPRARRQRGGSKGGSSGGSKDDASARGEGGSTRDSRPQARDDRRSGSSRSSQGGGRGGSGRGRSSGGGDRSSGGGRSQQGGGRSAGDDLPSDVEPAPKGRVARGEGQPQRARRVRVDHLP